MNQKIFTITENGLDQDHLGLLINHLIDENINAYQLQHLSNWIKNHNEPTVFKDKKIKDLKTLKKEFTTFLENEFFEELKISLEFKLKDQSKVA
jgi:hypothetical protein